MSPTGEFRRFSFFGQLIANLTNEDVQQRKLELVAEVARQIW